MLSIARIRPGIYNQEAHGHESTSWSQLCFLLLTRAFFRLFGNPHVIVQRLNVSY